MVSARGVIIGLLLVLGGFIAIYTVISPQFLFSIGVNVKTFTAIQQQFNIWGTVIGVFLVIGGLVAMGKFQ
jgi:hypothetical protein